MDTNNTQESSSDRRLSRSARPMVLGKPNPENEDRIDGIDSVVTVASPHDAELTQSECSREPYLKYEENPGRKDGTDSVKTCASIRDAELTESKYTEELNQEYEDTLERIEGTDSVAPSASHHDGEPFLENEEKNPVRIEETVSLKTSASHHDGELNIWSKVVNEIESWITSKKRNFLQDVHTLLENDKCEVIKKLKDDMNKINITNSKEIAALIGMTGKWAKLRCVYLIQLIRNKLVHYDSAKVLGNHPDKILEKIETVAPTFLAEIMHAIIMFCKNESDRHYICDNTSLTAYLDVLFKDIRFREDPLREENETNFDEDVNDNPSEFQMEKCFEGYDVTAQAGTSIYIAGLQKLENAQIVVLAGNINRAKKIRKELEDFDVECTFYSYDNKHVEKLQNKTPHVLIGINGAVNEVFTKRYVDSRNVKVLVIDETVSLPLPERLKLAVHTLLKLLPKEIQISCCGVKRAGVTDCFTKTQKVLKTQEEARLDGLQHYKIRVEETPESKRKALWDIYENVSIYQVVIFCNSPSQVDQLTEKMLEKDFSVSSQHTTDKNFEIDAFNSCTTRVLVTTDLNLPGLEILNISHVINFDCPPDANNYIRRLLKGFGWKGTVITLCTQIDEEILHNKERCYQTKNELYEL